MIEVVLNKVVYWVEFIVAVILVVLTGIALVTVAAEIYSVLMGGLLLPREEFVQIISTILEVFILVELFRIALAYMAHRNVLPTVLEAALVAVARKIVIFEPKGDVLGYAAALAALLLAISIAWYLLAKSHAIGPCDDCKTANDNKES